MPKQTVHPNALYAVDLGFLAAQRGERLVCRVLGVCGRDDAYARVYVVESTLSDRRYAAGRERMVRRDALVPVRPLEPAHAA